MYLTSETNITSTAVTSIGILTMSISITLMISISALIHVYTLKTAWRI